MRDLYSVLKSVAIVGAALGAAALVYYSTRDDPEVLFEDLDRFTLGWTEREANFYWRKANACRRKAEFIHSLLFYF